MKTMIHLSTPHLATEDHDSGVTLTRRLATELARHLDSKDPHVMCENALRKVHRGLAGLPTLTDAEFVSNPRGSGSPRFMLKFLCRYGVREKTLAGNYRLYLQGSHLKAYKTAMRILSEDRKPTLSVLRQFFGTDLELVNLAVEHQHQRLTK